MDLVVLGMKWIFMWYTVFIRQLSKPTWFCDEDFIYFLGFFFGRGGDFGFLFGFLFRYWIFVWFAVSSRQLSPWTWFFDKDFVYFLGMFFCILDLDLDFDLDLHFYNFHLPQKVVAKSLVKINCKVTLRTKLHHL